MLAAFALFLTAPAPDYDLILRNGTILDGTGKDGFRADIGIKDGVISAIGPNLKGAPVTIDETGQTISPGFIDVHTHAENILKLPRASNFVHDGVTTVVIGNCGGSTLKVKDFFSQLIQVHPSINVATLVGHNSVRSDAMGGSFNRPPTDAEQHKMESLVSDAMKEGAVGFSTGLEYVPGTYSKTDEVSDLAKIAKSFGGIYTSHMRSEGAHEEEALNETFEIGKKAGIPVEVSHIKLDARPWWGEADDRLKQIDDARAHGIAVTQDVYPYIAYSTTIGLLLPSDAFDGGVAALARRLADPTDRKAIIHAMADILKQAGEKDYSWVAIASNKDQRLNGLRIPAAAKVAMGSDSITAQVDLILKMVKDGASGVFFAMNEDDLMEFMRNPRTMIISDSTCESLQSGEVPHPRAYGSNARVLAEYVRNKGVLKLPDAIRRMTSLPAETFKLGKRGQIKEGYSADLVVFDADKIQDRATFANPRVYPSGIKDVLVNGQLVLRNGSETNAGAGIPVKREGA